MRHGRREAAAFLGEHKLITRVAFDQVSHHSIASAGR
jgi:hypothetical protein